MDAVASSERMSGHWPPYSPFLQTTARGMHCRIPARRERLSSPGDLNEAIIEQYMTGWYATYSQRRSPYSPVVDLNLSE